MCVRNIPPHSTWPSPFLASSKISAHPELTALWRSYRREAISQKTTNNTHEALLCPPAIGEEIVLWNSLRFPGGWSKVINVCFSPCASSLDASSVCESDQNEAEASKGHFICCSLRDGNLFCNRIKCNTRSKSKYPLSKIANVSLLFPLVVLSHKQKEIWIPLSVFVWSCKKSGDGTDKGMHE